IAVRGEEGARVRLGLRGIRDGAGCGDTCTENTERRERVAVPERVPGVRARRRAGCAEEALPRSVARRGRSAVVDRRRDAEAAPAWSGLEPGREPRGRALRERGRGEERCGERERGEAEAAEHGARTLARARRDGARSRRDRNWTTGVVADARSRRG